MSSETIASRPVYGSLAPVESNYHLFIADDHGGAAIVELAQHLSSDFWTNCEIIYINSQPNSASDHSDAIEALQCSKFYLGASIDAARGRISNSLNRAKMGTQIYLAGSEQLLNVSTMLVIEAGYDHRSVQTEQRGSLARRVQCVHCKGITPDVITQPTVCSHCGLLLLVRDHYSRRLAAFQGVNINAEYPDDIPETVEAFV